MVHNFNTTVTLQNYDKLRIDNNFRDVKLESDKITTSTTINTFHNHYDPSSNNRQRKYTNYDKNQTEWKEIVL